MRRISESGDLSRKLLNRSFTGPSRESALADLAAHVERQPSVHRRIERLRSVCTLQQTYRAGRPVLGERDVGDADIEEISAFELEVAQVKGAVAGIVQGRHFDGVHTVRKD